VEGIDVHPALKSFVLDAPRRGGGQAITSTIPSIEQEGHTGERHNRAHEHDQKDHDSMVSPLALHVWTSTPVS
jgi:hypothetical protein